MASEENLPPVPDLQPRRPTMAGDRLQPVRVAQCSDNRLHLACRRGDGQTAAALLRMGHSPNHYSGCWTPMHLGNLWRVFVFVWGMLVILVRFAELRSLVAPCYSFNQFRYFEYLDGSRWR